MCSAPEVRVRAFSFVLGSPGFPGGWRFFCEGEARFQGRRIVVGNRDNRLTKQRELFRGQLRDRLSEQLDLLVECFRLDLQFVELGQHQLLGLIAARFFLPFAHHDVAQHRVLFDEPCGFFGIRAG